MKTPVGKIRKNKQFGREHIDILALIVLAPDTKFKNSGLDMTVLEEVKRLNCEVAAAYIDPGWIKDENIHIKGINPF